MTLFCLNIMHCISLTPRRNTISAIFCRLVRVLRPSRRRFTQVLYFYIIMHGKRIFPPSSSTFEAAQCILFPILFTPIISQNCRHCKAPRLLCSINAISSPSCVFKLQNPIVLHCLIFPLKNWDVWSFFYGVNSPIEIHSCNSLYELQKNLKVTRNPRENATQGGTNIFTNTFVRHQIA